MEPILQPFIDQLAPHSAFDISITCLPTPTYVSDLLLLIYLPVTDRDLPLPMNDLCFQSLLLLSPFLS